MILCVLCDHVDFSKNWNLSAEQLEYYFTHLITKKLSPKKVWSMNDEAEMLEGKWLCRYIISDSLLSLFTKNLCYGNPSFQESVDSFAHHLLMVAVVCMCTQGATGSHLLLL